MASAAIGIDLGTTYSCAAIVENGKPKVIRSRLGYTTIPSIVAFVDGKPVVGHAAERKMILKPEDAIYGSKRLLGRTFVSGVIERFQPHFLYKLVGDDEGFVAAEVAGRTVQLLEVSTMILRELHTAVAEAVGHDVHRAVITVPAYFNDNQRQFVREAGKRAGLEVLRIINEPTAAALFFGFKQVENKRLLVFDLGGGTFDVSLVHVDGSVYSVLGTDGDTFLGGLDFDNRLVEHVIGKLEAAHGKPIQFDPIGMQRLRVAAQQTKHQLSLDDKAPISVPGLMLADGTPLHLEEVVSRDELERITSDLVERALEVTSRALVAAELAPGQIDDVLLVGGQTRMPIIQKRLRDLFGKDPSRRIHPDEVVALGAAIAADAHARMDAVALVDVLPLSIGIAEDGGRFHAVIKRNTPVPHTAKTSVTIQPGHTSHKVVVVQGERAEAADNDYLGMVVIENLPASPEPQSCELTFALDPECLLTVYMREGNAIREVKLATQQTPDAVLAELGAERIPVAPERAKPASQTPTPSGTAMKSRGLWARIKWWFRRGSA